MEQTIPVQIDYGDGSESFNIEIAVAEPDHRGDNLRAACLHLDETPHRGGCACHRCWWAHSVINGRYDMSFLEWRG